MSLTTTITLESSSWPIHQATPPSQSATKSHPTDRLKTILEQHKQCGDYLSKALHQWGKKSLDLASKSFSSKKEMMQVAEERIVMLAKVLVNPLTGHLFKKPLVLERDWVWERETHQFCQSHMHISPFDHQIMEENPSPHLFAQEMVDWLTPYISSVRESQSSALPIEQIQVLAKSAVKQRIFRQIREQIALTITENSQQLSLIKEHNIVARKEEEERAAAHVEIVQTQIETIRTSHADRLAAFQQQLEFIQKTYEQNIQSLDNQIDAAKKTNQAFAESLKSQVSEMQASHRITKENLERRIEIERQEVSRLENRFNSAEQAHRAIVQTQQEAISTLHNQNEQSKNRATQLAAEMTQQRAQATLLSEEIQNLRNTLAQQNQHINFLQEEINNADNSLCVIS